MFSLLCTWKDGKRRVFLERFIRNVELQMNSFIIHRYSPADIGDSLHQLRKPVYCAIYAARKRDQHAKNYRRIKTSSLPSIYSGNHAGIYYRLGNGCGALLFGRAAI